MTSARVCTACLAAAAVLAATSPAAAQCLYEPCNFVLDNSITVNHPSSAAKCDTIEVVLVPSEGYEMTILYTTGLQFVRGWHEKCGWGAGPCDVGLTAYEWSLAYYGPIHYVFIVNGTDQATFRVDFAKGSWSSKTAYRTDTTTMTILPGDPQLNIGVSASPTEIPADGSSTSAITVQCRTGNCAPASGRQVSLTTTLGSLGPAGASAVGLVTDANGKATATLTAANTPGEATLSATAEGRTATAAVTMSGPDIGVSTYQTAIPATGPTDDGQGSTLVDIYLRDGLGPLAGQSVRVKTDLGALELLAGGSPPAGEVTVLTDSLGEASVRLRASATPGTATITATYGTASDTTTVEMIGVTLLVEPVFCKLLSLPSLAFNEQRQLSLDLGSATPYATMYGTTLMRYRVSAYWEKPGAGPEPLRFYDVRISSPELPGGGSLDTVELLRSSGSLEGIYPFDDVLETDENGRLEVEVRVADAWKDSLDDGFQFGFRFNLEVNAACEMQRTLNLVDNLDILRFWIWQAIGKGPVWDDAFWANLSAAEDRLRGPLGNLSRWRQYVADGLGGYVNDRFLDDDIGWVSEQYLDRNALMRHEAWRWQVGIVKLLRDYQAKDEAYLNGLDYAPISSLGSAGVVLYPRKTTGQTEWRDAEARILDGWIRQEVTSFTWDEWLAAQNKSLWSQAGVYQPLTCLYADQEGTVVDDDHNPRGFPANGLDYPPGAPPETESPAQLPTQTDLWVDCPVHVSVVDAAGRRNGYDPSAAPGATMLRTDMRGLWWATLTANDDTSLWGFALPDGSATIELHAYDAGETALTLVSRVLGKTLTYSGLTVAAGDHATLVVDPAFPTMPDLVFDDGRRVGPAVQPYAAQGVLPAKGPAAGGTDLRVAGMDVIAGATVTVGGVAATNVRWLNGTTLAAVTGRAVRVGPGDVVVTNPGAQPVTLARAFTYQAAAGLVDVNADGPSDVVFYRPETGRWAMTTADGHGGFAATLGQWSAGWTIKPGDFSGDGATDLFFYNGVTGAWYVGTNNGQGAYTYTPGSWAPGWELAVVDLNGDGLADLFVYNPVTGAWYQCLTTGPGTFAYHGGAWSPGWALVAAELDGDGMGDLFVYNWMTGAWFRCVSDGVGGFTYAGGTWSPGWEVVAGDFDGDGLSDLLTYSEATGAWYRCRNTGTGFAYSPGAWSAGWTLRVGDFNGDGHADVFVYNPETGVWYECLEDGAGGFVYHGGRWSADWQVHVTDLTGDGQSDLLVYNAATGAYYQCLATATPGVFTYLGGQWDAGWTLLTGTGR